MMSKVSCTLLLTVLLGFAGTATAAPEPASKAAVDTKSATSQAATSVVEAVPVGPNAYERAFRFASSIVSDRKDMGLAQYSVVQTLLIAGDVDSAARFASSIEGWRRGVAYAEVASALAQAGRVDEAKKFVERAEQVRAVTEGWQNPRISAHVAIARARLGESREAEMTAAALAKADKQFDGQASRIRALRLIGEGKLDEALAVVSNLDALEDYDISWTRTEAYLDLAKASRKDLAGRKRALDKTIESARKIPGWARAEAIVNVSRELRLHGDGAARAKEILAEAETAIGAEEDTVPVKATIMASIAVEWAALGEADKAKALLEKARAAVPGAMTIERPALLGAIARGYYAAGDAATGKATLDESLGLARALKNSRPRALAMTAICNFIGLGGVVIDEELSLKLDAVFESLGAPW